MDPWTDPPPTPRIDRERLREMLNLRPRPRPEDRLAHPGYRSLVRLLPIAQSDTHQSKHVADFLLAWWNAGENGGWDPTDRWSVDASIGDDMLAVLQLVRDHHVYPDELGLKAEFEALWAQWRRSA